MIFFEGGPKEFWITVEDWKFLTISNNNLLISFVCLNIRESLNILSPMMSSPNVKEPCLTIFRSWKCNHSLHLVVATRCIMYRRTICKCIALKINIKSVIALVNGVTIFSTQLALWTISRDNVVSLSSATRWISS